MSVTFGDFTVDDKGNVHGNPPGQFEFGERYVTCENCLTRRDPREMKYEETDELLGHKLAESIKHAVCKDKEVCASLGKWNEQHMR